MVVGCFFEGAFSHFGDGLVRVAMVSWGVSDSNEWFASTKIERNFIHDSDGIDLQECDFRILQTRRRMDELTGLNLPFPARLEEAVRDRRIG